MNNTIKRFLISPKNRKDKSMDFIIFFLFLANFFLISCGPPFIKPDTQKFIKKKYSEEKQFILRKELKPGANFFLPKGEQVKVIIRFSDNWIKVYAYKHNKERLKATPVLSIFITEQESEKEVLNVDAFDLKFNEIFKPIKVK